MDSDMLLQMASLERQVADEIKARHAYYFRDDDPAAWGAVQTANLRAEALENLAKKYAA